MTTTTVMIRLERNAHGDVQLIGTHHSGTICRSDINRLKNLIVDLRKAAGGHHHHYRTPEEDHGWMEVQFPTAPSVLFRSGAGLRFRTRELLSGDQKMDIEKRFEKYSLTKIIVVGVEILL